MDDKCSIEIHSFPQEEISRKKLSMDEHRTRVQSPMNNNKSKSINKFIISCNFLEQYMLLRCHNILQAIQGRFDEIVPFEDKENCQDEEWTRFQDSGLVRYSSWSFTPSSSPNNLFIKRSSVDIIPENVANDNMLLGMLSNIHWASVDKKSPCYTPQDFPQWQLDAQRMFIKAHELFKYQNRPRNVSFLEEKDSNDTSSNSLISSNKNNSILNTFGNIQNSILFANQSQNSIKIPSSVSNITTNGATNNSPPTMLMKSLLNRKSSFVQQPRIIKILLNQVFLIHINLIYR
jgi:hypothetical protein